MSNSRMIKQSPINQGRDERIAYPVDFTEWGTPTSPVVVLKDANGTDVSGTNLSGSPSINGNTVITPLVISLSPNVRYRLEVKVIIGGNTLETWADVIGEE